MSQLHDVLRDQARACAALGSPFMGQLLSLIAARIQPGSAVADRVLTWQGDASAQGDSVPLRLAGGLHALVLQGRDPALVAAYPPNMADDARLWSAIEAAFTTHETFLLNWLDLPPQTNEVRRSCVLIPVAHLLAERFGLPLVLSELGASGGLNLSFDRFALDIDGQPFGAAAPALTLRPDWRGPLPPATPFTVSARRGVDLNPLTAPEDALRLRAYLWPDQPDRQMLTEAAIDAGPGAVDAGDVEAWLRACLSIPHPGLTHLIYHTIAWQYFPADTQARCRALLQQAGAGATAQAPIAWFGMEADHSGQKGAALTLRLWPGDVTLPLTPTLTMTLGRVDFHGRWVEWQPQEIAT